MALHNEELCLGKVDWRIIDDLLPLFELRLVVIRLKLVLLVLLVLCVASRPGVLVILLAPNLLILSLTGISNMPR